MPVSDVRIYDGTQWVSIKGTKGDTGLTGPAATITLGTVTTGAAGSSAAITDSDPSPNASTFNFTIPRGDAGQAATINVGTTTTGAAGSAAQVTNVGTANAATLNFAIPQGAKGDPGAGVAIQGTSTAYPPAATPSAGDLWIIGTGGTAGAPNSSSGPAAIGDGLVYEGGAWVNVGPFRGPKGDTGNAGTAATITVGTVTGLAAGATPTVNNTGTAANAIFAFGIPAGAQGAPGTNYQVYSTATTPTGMLAGAMWLVPLFMGVIMAAPSVF